MRNIFQSGLIAAFFGAASLTAYAATLSPNPVQVDVAQGQELSISRQIVLDGVGPAASKIDVFFLADNTGSMGGAINNVRNNAQDILSAISGGDDRFSGLDVSFGVASYNGDPREFGGTNEYRIGRAIQLLQPITASQEETQTAINRWRAGGGGDGPEANFFALHQLATNGGSTDGVGSTDLTYASGYEFGWRNDAVKLIVWFGDIRSHTTTVDLNEVVESLVANDVVVAAINTRGANQGIDTGGEAQSIVDATQGYIAHNVRAAADTVDAILNSVQTATEQVNLSLVAQNVPEGIQVSYRCASPEGCDNVIIGESRAFEMSITGQTVGEYSFETVAPFLNDILSNDTVRVRACLNDVSARGSRSKISVTWTDTGTSSYNVYRSTAADGPFNLVASTTSRYSTFGDRDVSAGTTYYYQVKEVDAQGNEFCESAIASTTTGSRFRSGPVNLAPVVNSTPITVAQEDSLYEYAVSATDPEGDLLTFTLGQAPVGMTVSATGVVQWTPTNSQVGTHVVSLIVSDSEGVSTNHIYSVDVSNTNDAPQITSTALLSARVAESYLYAVQATDVDFGDILTFFVDQGPAALTIDSATGLLSWTPAYGDGPSQTITVRVEDSAGASDSQTFVIAVDEPNRSPVISSTPITTATTTIQYVYAVEAFDPDVGDTQQFQLLTAPLGMVIDANTGEISWTPAADQFGTQTISVQVEDSTGATDVQVFDISIDRFNYAPSITSTPLSDVIATFQYSYLATATDADGDSLTWSLISAPTGMTISAVGLIEWLPADSEVGTYTVSIAVDDGFGGTAEQTFSLNVSPVPNDAPTISSVPPVTAVRDLSYVYAVVANDPEGDALSYTLVAGPAFLNMNSSTGELSGVPTPGDIGDHVVQLTVTDGANAVSQQYTLTVLNAPVANSPPTILSTPLQTVLEGDVWTYDVSATDAEGDSITYLLTSAPAGMAITGNQVSWQTLVNQTGTFPVEISVEDYWSAGTQQLFSLNVLENQQPVISSSPTLTVVEGNEYLYLVQASDPEGRPLVFSLINAPVGVTIDSNGLIRWMTQLGDAGQYNFSVRVADHLNEVALQAISIDVSAQFVNSAPVITTNPLLSAQAGSTYSYDVNASDADGDPLSFNLLVSPLGMVIDAVTGIVSWNPTSAQIGDHTVSVTVEDGNGGSAQQNYVISVLAAPNSAPVITSAPLLQSLIGQDYLYQVTATDADGDALDFSVAQGPTGLAISASGLVTWESVDVTLGDWPIVLAVSDGADTTTQSYSLTIAEPVQGSLTLVQTADIIDPNETVTFQVTTENLTSAVLSLTVNGTNQLLDSNGIAQFTPTTSGIYNVAAQAIAGGQLYSQTSTLRVRDLADTQFPTVSINTPTEAEELTSLMDVVGSVFDDNLYRFTLNMSPVGQAESTLIVEGFSNRTNELLGEIDSSLFTNGMHALTLFAEDLNGRTAETTVSLLVKGSFKPGAVQLSFIDMTLPIAGIPIIIERTYDSRIKSARDLGVGWDLSVRQGEYKNNREPGEGWSVATSGGFFRIPCYTAVEQAEHITEIRISETESYEFRPRVNLSGFGSVISGGCLGQAEFVQSGGISGASLQVIGSTNVFYSNSQGIFTFDLGDPEFGLPWEPSNVRLTTPDGRVFDVNIDSGISRIEDRNSNQLFISNNGVVNSSGIGVTFTRDSEGRIVQIQDPLGQTVGYGYDANNNLVSFTNQLIEETTYNYHVEPFVNHLQSIVLPSGQIISEFNYDEKGRLSEACNEDGCSTAEYDVAGRTQTNYDATGRSTTYLYDDEGNVIAVTDALGNTQTFAYDANGNMTEMVDAEGNVTLQTWDANSNLLSRTEPYEVGQNPADYTTVYSWDTGNRLLSVTNAAGGANHYAYDAQGNMTSIVDENGFELTSRTFDANGKVLSETDPFGTMTFAYGTDGFMQSLTDDQGITSTFTSNTVGQITNFSQNGIISNQSFDAMGRVDQATYGDVSVDFDYGYGQEWTSVNGDTIPQIDREFSANGKPTLIRNADGSESLWEYDPAGRVIASVDASGGRSTYVYDLAGRLISETDPLSYTTTYELDNNGRQTAVIDAELNRHESSYYPDGRVKTMQDGSGRTWAFSYTPSSASVTDELGRTMTSEVNAHGLTTRQINADGTFTAWAYLNEHPSLDGGELPTSFTDEGGRTRNFNYDSNGRLITASDFTGNDATYSYGNFGLTQIQNALGENIDFEFDSNGEVNRLVFADGSFKAIDRNAQRKVERVSLASGNAKDYVYDSMNRVVEETTSLGAQRQFIYAPSGQLQSTIDALGANNFNYLVNGALESMQASVGAGIEYVYDGLGRVVEKRISDEFGVPAAQTSYSYDGASRLTSILDQNNQLTTLDYDLAGRLTTKTLPNGITTTYVYDDRDQILSVTHTNASNAVIRSVTYSRNAGGEPNRVTWEDGSYVLISYDSNVRVTDEQFFDAVGALQKQISYQYDLAGKRTAKVIDGALTNYGYSVGGRLETLSGAETAILEYTSDGQVSSIQSSELINLSYNFEGQLSSANSTGNSASIVYDARGYRAAVSHNGNTRKYLRMPSVTGVYENPQVVLDDANTILHSYNYVGDVPHQRIDATGSVYYLTDGMGSVIGLVDDSGNLLGTQTYNAFGEVLAQTGDMSVNTDAGGDFRFHGQWLDSATGFYYMRARDYDASTGRFLSSDPAEPKLTEPESLNRYQFANANPMTNSDPSGRFTLVSVNIGLNVSATLRSIAVHIAKDYLLDKARSVIGSVVLGAVKNFTAMTGFNPWGMVGVTNPGAAGRVWEQKIQNFICSTVPDVMRDVVWFEPVISGGKASANGYGCPGGGGSFGGAGSSKPDFMLSKTEPRKLGNRNHRNIKAYLIGETKLSLKTFYKAYVSPGYNVNQFRQIVQFAEERVYARTAVFLALYKGGSSTGTYQAGLSSLLTSYAVPRGVLPVMVSAF